MRIASLGFLLAASLAGFGCATQYVAAHWDRAAELGPPWIRWGEARIYPPWAWVGWSRSYDHRAPALFRTASGIATAGALVGCAGAVAGASLRTGRRRSRAHGSARWATTRELDAAGLLAPAGVVLGQTGEATFGTGAAGGETRPRGARRLGRLIRHDGPEHVLCFAPTRSGKGVGVVVPTLLSWPGSVIVYDIKKENWALTAGWRRQFSRVWRFEPTAADSVRFNPLLEVRRGVDEVKDAQNVADILVDPTGEKETRDHWQLTAHGLLVGAILHVLYAEREKSLAGVGAFLADPGRSQLETLERMLRTAHGPEGPHRVVAQAAREVLSKSENEMSGVFSTALACLGLYRDPAIARSTGASDFRIADLMNADAPVSLYLVVPPSDLVRTRPLVRLMLNQIGRRLTESMAAGGAVLYRHRLLLLLDEFPSLGRLDFFESALGFVASYGIKALLIAQSLNQLEKAYGTNSAIVDHCHVRLCFAPNDDRTARRISDLLGQTTEGKMQRSFSGSGLFLSHRTESEQEFGRPLMTPSEVAQLGTDDGILLVGGGLPYRTRKVRYFLDPRFRDRGGWPAPQGGAQQERELVEVGPTPWETAQGETVDGPGVLRAGGAEAGGAASEENGDARAGGVVGDEWKGFVKTADDEPFDDADAPASDHEELPL